MHQTAGSDPSPVGTGEDCATEPLRTAGCFSLLVFIGVGLVNFVPKK
jgi:hypothetical protein